MTDWQTIETAPRDGTYIIALLGKQTSRLTQFYEGRRFVIRHEGVTDSGYDLGWSLFPGVGGCSDATFTHWTPLPPAPTVLESE